jgi:methyltransferase family protein
VDDDAFDRIAAALNTPRAREALRGAILSTINELSRNIHHLLPIVDAVRSALFVLDNIPLSLARDHGALRVEAIQAAPPGGLHMEFGVWKGAWITVMANAFPDRRFYGFDSFEGLPANWSALPPGYFDLGGVAPDVPDNVELIKGWFDRSLPPFLAAQPDPVSFIHMDCDLYTSTMTVLCLLRDRLQVGTTIVLDDYMLEPGWRQAEHKAFHDFCAATSIEFSYIGFSREAPTVSASVVLTKV